MPSPLTPISMPQPAPESLQVEAVKIAKGTVIFKQGDKGDAAYLIESGAIGIFREVDGKRVPIATIGPGDLFGEMAVIDGSPRAATAYALQDSTAKVISVKVMIETMRGADPFIRWLIHMLINNLRSVHDIHTPRSCSLADSVAALQGHGESLARFQQGNIEPELKAALRQKLKDFETALAELRDATAEVKGHDRRASAAPAEAELPAA